MTRVRRSLSFSNLVAIVALFFALGGTVYAAAGKISGSQIKPKSIPAGKIKPNSLTGNQVKAGSLTGTQVVGSTLSGVSAAAIGTIQYVAMTVALNPTSPTGTTGIATCPSGMNVIGGGATVNNVEIAIASESAPTASRTGWSAIGFGEIGTTMTVTAICTPVTSSSG